MAIDRTVDDFLQTARSAEPDFRNALSNGIDLLGGQELPVSTGILFRRAPFAPVACWW